jgi:hypothetical protein
MVRIMTSVPMMRCFYSCTCVGTCIKRFSGHTDMIISLAVRALETPISMTRKQVLPPQPYTTDTSASTPVTVFESQVGEAVAADTIIVSVSDDGTARVFPFSTTDISLFK